MFPSDFFFCYKTKEKEGKGRGGGEERGREGREGKGREGKEETDMVVHTYHLSYSGGKVQLLWIKVQEQPGQKCKTLSTLQLKRLEV
jgi:hypothetical protein